VYFDFLGSIIDILLCIPCMHRYYRSSIAPQRN